MVKAKFRSAEVAAEWWTDKLIIGAIQDASSNLSIPDKSILKSFETLLASRIDKEIRRIGECKLEVHFRATGVLSEIAEKVKIDNGAESLFPKRTHMLVTKTSVKVVAAGEKEAKEIYRDTTEINNAKTSGKNSDGGK